MKMFSNLHFNLPAVFSRFDLNGIAPPKIKSNDTRNVADALDYPNVQFYNPDALHFPAHDWATPKNQGLPRNPNVTLGVEMVKYGHQATWDRCDYGQTGPVREFFRRQYYDNSIKHL